MDIDLRIRATEDPDFDQYMLNKAYQEELAKQASQKSKQKKLKQRTEEEAARKNFIAFRNQQKVLLNKTQKRAYLDYLVNERAQKQAQNVRRDKFIAQRTQLRIKERQRKEILLAKMRSRISRLPASVFEAPRKRIPANQRTKFYEKIKKQTQEENRRK